MKKNVFFIFIAAFISIVLPIPARFGYGIIILIFLNFIVLFNILLKYAISYLNLSSLSHAVSLSVSVFLTILFKQLLILYSPVIALTLSFSLYLTTFSSFIIGLSLNEENKSLKRQLSFSMKYAGLFTVISLLVFLLRDIFSYGTITLPIKTGLYEIHLLALSKFEPAVILASIPGGLIILAFSLAIVTGIHRKIKLSEGKENDN